ncbi:MAG TPA: tRNA epoxyqueuosine(34) reductase QueG [bacterium]|nr:tRNA epoxyqueuosine(34) reductase QueG [bacterium]
MDPEEKIKRLAYEAGFELCGIASLASPPEALKELKTWLALGRQADMAWMERQAEKRLDPGKVLSGARSLICVGLIYNTGRPYSTDVFPMEGRTQTRPEGSESKGWIARYAWGEDYHSVMARKLAVLEHGLRTEIDGLAGYRSYCDTGPVSEKVWAAAAGLGWQGKNTNLINRKVGSWFFLAEILSTLDLAPDPPALDHCGTCTRCLDACPTQAFPKAYELDAGRCLSYLTIEKRGELPQELLESVGANVYGCDICQDVCPWNHTRVLGREAAFEARPGLMAPDLAELETMDDAAFAARFKDSAIKRTKAAGLRRNAAVARSGPAAQKPATRKV